MSAAEIRKELVKAGAVLEGNYFFVLKSGKVSNKYINLDTVFIYPELIDHLGEMLAQQVEQDFDVITGPAVGGIPLVYAAARNINVPGIRTVWADKNSAGSFEFGRAGFAKAVHKKRVLILEDVVTTGNSAKAVGDLVQQAEGRVVAYSFIWNRGDVTAATMGAPVYALITESAPSWVQGEHEMWGKWPLVEDIGHPEHVVEYAGGRVSLLI